MINSMPSRSTRSSKTSRTEGLIATRSSHNIATTHRKPSLPQANTSRKKRPRDSVHAIKDDIQIKKARYAVEIESRPISILSQPKSLAVADGVNTKPGTTLKPDTPKPAPPPPQQQQASTQTPKPTIHHQKVANGIKHELDRLQPSPEDVKDEKRKLRSQEGTRFKSELSLYFPEYDEVIGNDPKEDHFLNLDTPIIIVDSAKSPAKSQQNTSSTARSQNGPQTSDYPVKKYPNSLFDNLNEAHRVDFSFLDTHCKDREEDYPLPDSYYQTVHRKPERNERLVRNTDKGRAQHEKDQVIRLLEGLQGHDWLKLMGVSGITESRKKEFEPARDHFIKGCLTIIEKFKIWRDEEKRRRLEKELATAAAEADEQEVEGDMSDGDPPDYSDVDASAARQLHEEAIARSAPIFTSRQPKPKAEEIPAATIQLEKDFKSFFSKPYLREAALHKHRRSGRSVAAWGQPVPDVAEEDFLLPEEFRDEETLKAHARRKRRDRRISKD